MTVFTLASTFALLGAPAPAVPSPLPFVSSVSVEASTEAASLAPLARSVEADREALVFVAPASATTTAASEVGAATALSGCPGPSGASATVIVPASPALTSAAGPLEDGDAVAVFADGVCVGAATWTGTALALSVWADDPYTAEPDGFAAGTALEFRLFDASAGAQRASGITVAFEDGFGATGGLLADHVYVVRQATPTAGDAAGVAEATVGTPYPNPATSAATVAVRADVAQRVVAEVYDTVGRRVGASVERALGAGESADLAVNLRGLSPGLYVVRVAGETFTQTRRITVVR